MLDATGSSHPRYQGAMVFRYKSQPPAVAIIHSNLQVNKPEQDFNIAKPSMPGSLTSNTKSLYSIERVITALDAGAHEAGHKAAFDQGP